MRTKAERIQKWYFFTTAIKTLAWSMTSFLRYSLDGRERPGFRSTFVF
jgi:hypothetical protein